MATKVPVNTGKIELDNKINEWLKWNKDSKAGHEVEELVQKNNIEILSNLFLERLKFGTAGLRGRMGPGYSQMNDVVIVQTGQGLSNYLLNAVSNASEKGVIIGYDGRHCSKRFAELTATIFIAKHVKVYLFSKVVPTPFIPYGVLKYKCAAGIMVTASHNLENLEPIESSWDVTKVYVSPLYKDPLSDIMQLYFHGLKQKVLYPDPEFSTVEFPNPEEGESALELSIKTANENSSSIIIANDPDADRLACAV